MNWNSYRLTKIFIVVHDLITSTSSRWKMIRQIIYFTKRKKSLTNAFANIIAYTSRNIWINDSSMNRSTMNDKVLLFWKTIWNWWENTSWSISTHDHIIEINNVAFNQNNRNKILFLVVDLMNLEIAETKIDNWKNDIEYWMKYKI